MKKLLTLLALMLVCIGQAFAYDFEVNGIYYNKSGSNATVTYKTSSYNSYSGDISIPSAVTYDNVTYSVTSIGNHAFDSCSGLTSVIIPNSVKSIEYGAFRSCGNLTFINIPSSVTRIESSAFGHCSVLSSIVIPGSVKKIESSTFANCSLLSSVTIGYGVESIGMYAFQECGSLTSVNIPNSVKTIEYGAFSTFYGNSVTDVTLSSNLTRIEESIFWGWNKLQSITIPNGVTSIGEMAFKECASLTDVYNKALEPQTIISTSFDLNNVSRNVTLHVPEGCRGAYEAASYWNQFYAIVDDVPLTKLTALYLDKSEYVCVVGGESLTASVYSYEPDDALISTVTYSVDDTDIASVDANTGEIVGLHAGTTTLTATAIDGSGVTATATIRVSLPTFNLTIEGAPDGTQVTINGQKYGDGGSIAAESLTPSDIVPDEVDGYGYEVSVSDKDVTVTYIRLPFEKGALCGITLQGGYVAYDEASGKFKVSSVFTGGTNGVFVVDGNMSEGFTFYCVGAEKYLTHANTSIDNSVATATSDEASATHYEWKHYGNADFFKIRGTSSNYINYRNGYLSTWNSTYSLGAQGSVMTFPSVEEIFGECKSTALDVLEEAAFIPLYDEDDILTATNGINAITYDESIDSRIAAIEDVDGFMQTFYSSADGKKFSFVSKNSFSTRGGTYYLTVPNNLTGRLTATANKKLFSVFTATYDATHKAYKIAMAYNENIYLPVTGTASAALYPSATPGYYTFKGNDETDNPVTLTCVIGSVSVYQGGIHLDSGKNIVVWGPDGAASKWMFERISDEDYDALVEAYEVGITFKDGDVYNETETVKYPKVTYTRSFKNTNWQALYVPFSMDYDEWSTDFEIARIYDFVEYDDNDDGVFDRTYLVIQKKKSGSTEPNYPYLIRAKSTGDKTLVLNNKTLAPAESNSIDCSSVDYLYTFTGSYTKVTNMYANGYYALSGGALKVASNESVVLGAQRWYMSETSRTDSSSTRAQVIQILVDGEDDVEGICEFGNSEISKFENVGFDLTGRMVSTKANNRGVNIVNGKKIIR